MNQNHRNKYADSDREGARNRACAATILLVAIVAAAIYAAS